MSDQKDNQGVALFQDNSGALSAANDAAAVARATQEIQAGLVIAQRFPRDEVAVKTKILKACSRKELAEVAEYEYSRGGTRITGPTIDLLRAIANRWGNIRYGWTEVDRRDGQSSVRCFAWDMQTNGQAERTFTVKHWRDTRDGGYVLTDERDIYELLANQAARRVRACLEEVIDSDMVTAAVEQCRVTMRTGEKTPLADRAVAMVTAFAEFGVTQPMIETRLGNKLDAVSENQLASLRRVFKSLKDGVGKREDYFKPETAKPDFETNLSKSATVASPSATKSASDATKLPVTETHAPTPLGASGAPQPAQSHPQAPSEAPKPVSEPAKGNGFNALKAVTGLCDANGIKYGEIMGWLAEKGATDGSLATLEEVPKLILKAVCDRWAEVQGDILAARKGELL